MLSFEEAEDLIGHTVGGICPFGVKEVSRYILTILLGALKPYILLQSSSNSAIELTLDELYIYSNCIGGWMCLKKKKKTQGVKTCFSLINSLNDILKNSTMSTFKITEILARVFRA